MGQLGGSKSIEVDAPIAACWAIAADVASAPGWQKGLEDMKVLDRDAEGRPSRCETTSDAKVRKVKTIVRFTYEEPTRLSWTQEKGDLKRLDGAWVLEDLGGDRTRVTYTLDGDPGRVLGMLLRGPVEGKVTDVMVNGRPAEFKARAEGG
ncbi:MAG: SRPBCC family protein [Actinomycetota bacterium]|nr:SRPBCC family protein [Actinomycetota bacterium]